MCSQAFNRPSEAQSAPSLSADAVAAWHPKLQRLLRYWRSIHPDRDLPGRQHVDPLAIRDLLPGLWMLDVQRTPFRLRYRLAGTRIVPDRRRAVIEPADGECAGDPFADPPVQVAGVHGRPEVQSQYLEDAQIAQLFAVIADPRDRAMFLLMLRCGLRVGEGRAL